MKKTIKVIDLANKIINDELEDGFKILKDGNFVLVYNREDKIFTSERGNIEYIKFDYFNLNKEVQILEEDKEIELIPIEDFNISYNLGFIDYKNIEVLKNHLNKDFQRIFDTLDLLIENQKILEKAVNELKKGK